MKTFIVTILSFFAFELCIGQDNCPLLYRSVQVICEGRIAYKCVPYDYTCKGCWKIVWPKCNSNERGGDNYANSYEAAENLAEERKEMFEDRNCTGSVQIDYSRYTIYLLGGNDCSNIISDRRVFADLKSRVMSLLNGYEADKLVFQKFLDKLPYNPGLIVQEYHDMLKESDNNVKDLSNIMKYIANEHIGEIEDKIERIQAYSGNLAELRSDIKEKIKALRKEQEMQAKEKQSGPKTFSEIKSNDDQYVIDANKQTIPRKNAFDRYIDSVEQVKKQQANKTHDTPRKNAFDRYIDSVEQTKRQQANKTHDTPRKNAFDRYIDSVERAKSQAKQPNPITAKNKPTNPAAPVSNGSSDKKFAYAYTQGFKGCFGNTIFSNIVNISNLPFDFQNMRTLEDENKLHTFLSEYFKRKFEEQYPGCIGNTIVLFYSCSQLPQSNPKRSARNLGYKPCFLSWQEVMDRRLKDVEEETGRKLFANF